MYFNIHKELQKICKKKPNYKNELLDIYDFFEQKIKLLRSNGINHNNIILDPGIGFGKNLKHNMSLNTEYFYFSFTWFSYTCWQF